MPTTIQDVHDQVAREVGESSNIFIEVADTLNWANGAVRDIIRDAEFSNLEPPTEDTFPAGNYIPLAVDLYRVKLLTINGSPIKQKNFEELLDQNPYLDINQSGTPEFFWKERTLVSGKYQARIRIWPSTISISDYHCSRRIRILHLQSKRAESQRNQPRVF